jgi:hypothetical protein
MYDLSRNKAQSTCGGSVQARLLPLAKLIIAITRYSRTSSSSLQSRNAMLLFKIPGLICVALGTVVRTRSASSMVGRSRIVSAIRNLAFRPRPSRHDRRSAGSWSRELGLHSSLSIFPGVDSAHPGVIGVVGPLGVTGVIGLFARLMRSVISTSSPTRSTAPDGPAQAY